MKVLFYGFYFWTHLILGKFNGLALKWATKKEGGTPNSLRNSGLDFPIESQNLSWL